LRSAATKDLPRFTPQLKYIPFCGVQNFWQVDLLAFNKKVSNELGYLSFKKLLSCDYRHRVR